MNVASQNVNFNTHKVSTLKKIINIVLASLLFGFGWHIRGSGTSDPAVAFLILVLFLGVVFSPKIKFNYLIFGLIVITGRIMRRGWGTFVAQAGIPGIYEGHLLSYVEAYDVVVPWWQGYFWLFIVGLAWSSFPSLLLGGSINYYRKFGHFISILECLHYPDIERLYETVIHV